jgi:hypothetical protein
MFALLVLSITVESTDLCKKRRYDWDVPEFAPGRMFTGAQCGGNWRSYGAHFTRAARPSQSDRKSG